MPEYAALPDAYRDFPELEALVAARRNASFATGDGWQEEHAAAKKAVEDFLKERDIAIVGRLAVASVGFGSTDLRFTMDDSERKERNKRGVKKLLREESRRAVRTGKREGSK